MKVVVCCRTFVSISSPGRPEDGSQNGCVGCDDGGVAAGFQEKFFFFSLFVDRSEIYSLT